MAEIHGKYVYDDSLRPGNSEDGGLSQLLFDDEGKLADHAVFIPDDVVEQAGDERVPEPDVDPPSLEEILEAIGVTIGVTIAVVDGAMRAAPYVRKWWSDTYASRSKNLGLRRRRRSAAEPPALPAATEDFTRAVDVALDQLGERMSGAEAKQRLAAMLVAAAFIAEQIRVLGNARLNDAELAELSNAMGRLTAQRVTDAVNRMLEADASLLDERTSNEFLRIFGGGREIDGRYVPIRNERIRNALRLTSGSTHGDGENPITFAAS